MLMMVPQQIHVLIQTVKKVQHVTKLLSDSVITSRMSDASKMETVSMADMTPASMRNKLEM